jgi:hypothetical protein
MEATMNIKKLLMTVAAPAVLTTAGAGLAAAAPWGHGGPSPGHHSMNHHDRYWRPEYRHGYVNHDRVFAEMRHHHYYRFLGSPYWFHGRYVVRTYDRFGHVVFIEVNPYTGGFIGVIRF